MFGRHRRHDTLEIAPDEIFLDSSNLPAHDASRFEGRVERPVSAISLTFLGIIFVCITIGYAVRAYSIEVTNGTTYAAISRDNRLERSVIFSTRGVIYDRTHTELAWNEPASTSTSATSPSFATRAYKEMPGLAHVLGFVRSPKADAKGAWWREEYTAVSGAELAYDKALAGTNGSSMVETDAHGTIERTDIVVPPQNGTDITLSIDADVQSALYTLLYAHAQANRFQGGAAVLMDVQTGEILAMTSFPEYDHAGFARGDSAIVKAANADPHTPALNRAVAGAYTPGSIVKPLFAAAALQEHLIDPLKKILSTGALILPNPYDPAHPSIFKDWRVHGWIDMREGIAQSSDEYFYTIGGGYKDQKGLGIAKIDEYARLFGLGTTTGSGIAGEVSGTIPTPAWKEKVFGVDDPWRIGDTYHTVIGQYGFQVTPLQVARYVSAIANGGTLYTPHLIAGQASVATPTGINPEYLQIVREGMRLGVTSGEGTSKALNLEGVHIAGKTGTAQLGTHNQSMNSWAVGFWPYEHPRYAYAIMLEKAPAGTLSGAAPSMRPFFDWLITHKPEYVR